MPNVFRHSQDQGISGIRKSTRLRIPTPRLNKRWAVYQYTRVLEGLRMYLSPEVPEGAASEFIDLSGASSGHLPVLLAPSESPFSDKSAKPFL